MSKVTINKHPARRAALYGDVALLVCIRDNIVAKMVASDASSDAMLREFVSDTLTGMSFGSLESIPRIFTDVIYRECRDPFAEQPRVHASPMSATPIIDLVVRVCARFVDYDKEPGDKIIQALKYVMTYAARELNQCSRFFGNDVGPIWKDIIERTLTPRDAPIAYMTVAKAILVTAASNVIFHTIDWDDVMTGLVSHFVDSPYMRALLKYMAMTPSDIYDPMCLIAGAFQSMADRGKFSCISARFVTVRRQEETRDFLTWLYWYLRPIYHA